MESSPSRAIKFILWFLLLGLLTDLGAFFILSNTDPAYAISVLTTNTVIIYDNQIIENSPTPFQPLPTETPTPTSTPTSTPTLTPTATATNTPLPTSTPRPAATRIPATPTSSDGLPVEFIVYGVTGHSQSQSLSCEARSASDWADYYGFSVSESDIQSSYASTDNPETGFVGSPYGAEGQLPPNDYGVHAEPVASILRSYGVPATATKGLSYYQIREQIASGNPVIAWIIGNVWNGSPVSYTSSDGATTTVARYEHTVIVIGYDAYGVTVIDGSMTYWRSKSDFLNSFSVLGYMAVIHQ
jgi:uncharacterized protein YvpB